MTSDLRLILRPLCWLFDHSWTTHQTIYDDGVSGRDVQTEHWRRCARCGLYQDLLAGERVA
jgi:hypothetical protein